MLDSFRKELKNDQYNTTRTKTLIPQILLLCQKRDFWKHSWRFVVFVSSVFLYRAEEVNIKIWGEIQTFGAYKAFLHIRNKEIQTESVLKNGFESNSGSKQAFRACFRRESAGI